MRTRAPRSGFSTSAFLGVVCALAFSGPARADRVDGEWCDAKGLRIVIRGDAVTTPGGATARGQNRRHVFSYDAPAGEALAGHVRFQQENDDLMRSTSDDAGGAREWRRCRPVS